MTLTLKEIAKTADKWYAAREARLAADKVAKALKDKENELAAVLINNLAKDATGVDGKTVHVEVAVEEVPQLVDRDKFMAFVWKQRAWELIPASINKTAYRERVEDGQKVPGTNTMFVPKLHFSKK